jgi:membrane dipeptidase
VTDLSARATRLYAEAIVVDAHNDLPSRVLDDGYDPDVRHAPGFGPEQGHTDLPRLLESGVTAQFMAAWVDARYARLGSGASFARALELIDVIHAFVDRHPAALRLATTAAEVRRAKTERRVAILVGVEGGHAIESSLDNLRELYARGTRYLTLTWNNGNDWAGSSIGADGTRTGGLTPFGRDVIREMNRLGMVVDIAHLTLDGVRQAAEVSRKPLLLSHTVLQTNFARSISAEHARLVARTGGVIGIFPVNSGGYHGFSGYVQHIERMIKAVGVDHVGIGTDMDGISPSTFVSWTDYSEWPSLAAALLAEGHSREDVGKLLGGNFLRVYRASAA